MRVGILGSGRMGATLGTIFARAGHQVTFSYARRADTLARRAQAAGHGARAGTPADAARDADAVLLAVHWSRVRDVLHQAGPLAGKVVITCSLPMNARDTSLVIGHTSSGAEALARKIPRAHVVSAFGTVPSEVLFSVFARRQRRRRPTLVYCGNNAHAKKVAARLVRDTGFDPMDVGALKMARYLEPFTMLVAEIAYERAGGPTLSYRFEKG